MWVIFDGGFVSIVRHSSKKGTLHVRARVRTDLEAFLRLAGRRRMLVRETPDADYRYRADLTDSDVGKALVGVVLSVDYPNFKARVAARQGEERSRAYGTVWAVLAELDERFRRGRVLY